MNNKQNAKGYFNRLIVLDTGQISSPLQRYLSFLLPRYYFVILLSLLLTACANTPTTHFYILEALSQTPSATTTTKARVFGLGPLTLPSLLERQQIITRTAINTVELAEFHQWAAPLKDSILQVLTKNLILLLPNDNVRSYPWSAYGNVQYRLIIELMRFDAGIDNAAVLEASWAIMDEQTHTIINNGHTVLKRPLINSSYSVIAQTMSQLLDDFSQQLAIVLQTVAVI